MEAKERLVVLNGSKCLERVDENGQWETYHVEAQGNLPHGVYELHRAKEVTPASKGMYAGTIIHADRDSVYQDLGEKGLVRFDVRAFAEAPPMGRFTLIQYADGRAHITDSNRLAGAHAAVTAIDKQMRADGLDMQQRAIVAARVQHTLSNSIAAGKLPEVRIREEVEATTNKEQEHTR